MFDGSGSFILRLVVEPLSSSFTTYGVDFVMSVLNDLAGIVDVYYSGRGTFAPELCFFAQPTLGLPRPGILLLA